MVDKKLDQGSWNVYQRKRWWAKRYEEAFNEDLPDICPLAVHDDRNPPEYNSVEDAQHEINTAKKCDKYSEELESKIDNWMINVPGRCDGWNSVFWDCKMFRVWVRLMRHINGVK